LKIIAPSKHVQDVMLKWSSFGIPPVCKFLRITSGRPGRPGRCLQVVLLLCAEEDATASFDFNPGADGDRLEPGQLLRTWHQHLVRDVFRRSYDQYPRRQTVERTRASRDPYRYSRRNWKKTASKCLLNCRWSESLSKRKLHL
jgi:hypothetical protein